ncbi:hypothetical protein P280DRAFT_474781 [Massarina eburnea CBS 473.64]|uniref:Uncharacterized protein n=1 Tax=Massarina eburnea CBS 473.64 TaxID=1395130 RepID=A0A6A6RFW8_9PLEO|nr:hypothetical protein P280DRAFT_474781 [Massarina eburnea CBS 473.64]
MQHAIARAIACARFKHVALDPFRTTLHPGSHNPTTFLCKQPSAAANAAANAAAALRRSCGKSAFYIYAPVRYGYGTERSVGRRHMRRRFYDLPRFVDSAKQLLLYFLLAQVHLYRAVGGLGLSVGDGSVGMLLGLAFAFSLFAGMGEHITST